MTATVNKITTITAASQIKQHTKAEYCRQYTQALFLVDLNHARCSSINHIPPRQSNYFSISPLIKPPTQT